MFLKRFFTFFLILALLGRCGFAGPKNTVAQIDLEAQAVDHDHSDDEDADRHCAKCRDACHRPWKCHLFQRVIIFLLLGGLLAGFSLNGQVFINRKLDEILPRVDEILEQCGNATSALSDLRVDVSDMAEVCGSAVDELSELQDGVADLADIANKTFYKLSELQPDIAALTDVANLTYFKLSELQPDVANLADIANQSLYQLVEVDSKLDRVQSTCQQMMDACSRPGT